MITTSSEKALLDLDFIHDFLKDIYWAAARTKEELQTTIDSSFCMGIYLSGKQIGFARVITDYVVMAYMMDVFIAAEHRGKGYSSQLVEALLEAPELRDVNIWRLATRDAPYLYEKFGFDKLAHPERMMEKIKK